MQYMQDEDISGQSATMPTRTPIIPTTLGNRILLRALHNEMKEKDIIKQTINKHHTESTASSGIHSNSISEESEGHRRHVSIKKKPKHRRKTAARTGPETTMNRKPGAHKHDSSSERGDSNDTDRSSDSERSDKTYSSSEESHSTARASGTVSTSWTKGHKDNNVALSRSQAGNRGTYESARSKNNVELSERDKQEIREGYERFAVNGEHQSTGNAFGARVSAFNKVTRGVGRVKDENFSESHVTFPLEEAAAGECDDIGLKEAKAFEKNAKQKTKTEKRAIAEAKLTVSEAKLTEFEAKLRARQARIDERHAKLCHRRALIKQAEERLQMLEARLDDEEENQRERERRVKNRERRVKQEEAGIQIKEASLKKRETKVTDDLMEIERRRKIVEEKEQMSSTMNDIMTKRESLHHGEKRDKQHSGSSTLGRLLRKPASKEVTSIYGTLDRKRNARSETSKRREEKQSNPSSPTSPPIPIPRKSLESRDFPKTERRGRSNSLDSESFLTSEEIYRSAKPDNEGRAQKYPVGSLPRLKNKNAIMV